MFEMRGLGYDIGKVWFDCLVMFRMVGAFPGQVYSLFEMRGLGFAWNVVVLCGRGCGFGFAQAQHRGVKQRGLAAPRHSEAYMSFGVRYKELPNMSFVVWGRGSQETTLEF